MLTIPRHQEQRLIVLCKNEYRDSLRLENKQIYAFIEDIGRRHVALIVSMYLDGNWNSNIGIYDGSQHNKKMPFQPFVFVLCLALILEELRLPLISDCCARENN